MSGEGLDGISIGDRATQEEGEEPNIQALLDELNVQNLSDLSDEQARELAKALDEDEELEGISVATEGGERTSRSVRARARQAAAREQEQVLEQQLEELQNIDDDTELLQKVAAQTSTTNDLLRTTTTILSDIVESNIRGPSLAVKEANQISFDKSNSTRKVVDNESISTSAVTVKANPENAGDVYIGGGNLQVGNGFRMEAGESRTFQVDVLDTTFQIVSEEKDDQYTYIALGEKSK